MEQENKHNFGKRSQEFRLDFELSTETLAAKLWKAIKDENILSKAQQVLGFDSLILECAIATGHIVIRPLVRRKEGQLGPRLESLKLKSLIDFEDTNLSMTGGERMWHAISEAEQYDLIEKAINHLINKYNEEIEKLRPYIDKSLRLKSGLEEKEQIVQILKQFQDNIKDKKIKIEISPDGTMRARSTNEINGPVV